MEKRTSRPVFIPVILIFVACLSYGIRGEENSSRRYGSRNQPRDVQLGQLLVSKNIMTQAQAFSYCRANNMELVSIENGVKNNLATQFLEFVADMGYAWTSGQADPAGLEEGEYWYRWQPTGDPVTMHNFEQIQPQLDFTKKEWRTTGILLSPVSSKWALDLQAETHHAMCQVIVVPTEPPTEPTTTVTTTTTTTTTEIPEFECESAGIFADTRDCTKYHVCVADSQGGFIDNELGCPTNTVWCQNILACAHPTACPCQISSFLLT